MNTYATYRHPKIRRYLLSKMNTLACRYTPQGGSSENVVSSALRLRRQGSAIHCAREDAEYPERNIADTLFVIGFSAYCISIPPKAGIQLQLLKIQKEGKMTERKRQARAAGFWYLLMAIAGGFGTMYVPMSILAIDDPGSTAQNIVEAGWIYPLSITSGLASQAIFIFLALALYRLFQDVDRHQARFLVIFVAAAVPIGFVNYLNLIEARTWISDSGYLQVFGADQLQVLALNAVNQYAQGILIVQVFWGLWLLPLGLLFVRAEFMPTWLGILLIINCFSYLIITATQLLELPYVALITYSLMPFLILGEFAAIFWLLFIGVKKDSH